MPYDWNAETVPATSEIQLGYNVNDKVAIYGDALFGLGGDRPYDTGSGIGLRLKY